MHRFVRAPQDKWRNIQKCEKRRSVPSREASQPSRWSINSTPAGRTRCCRLCVNLHSQQCAVQSPMPGNHTHVLSTADHQGRGCPLLPDGELFACTSWWSLYC